MSTDRTQKCKDRIGKEWSQTLKELRARIKHERKEDEDDPIFSFGYGFDYVPAGTFEKQRRGYFRWTLSGGGPSSEIRFFADPGFRLERAEYWFMDWFDGAKRNIKAGPAFEVISEIWARFEDIDSPRSEYERARE